MFTYLCVHNACLLCVSGAAWRSVWKVGISLTLEDSKGFSCIIFFWGRPISSATQSLHYSTNQDTSRREKNPPSTWVSCLPSAASSAHAGLVLAARSCLRVVWLTSSAPRRWALLFSFWPTPILISRGSHLLGSKSTLNIHWKNRSWNWSSSPLATWCEELTHRKRPWCWERLKVGGERDDRGWCGWMASPIQRTCFWVNSGSWSWTGRPGILQSVGL